MSGDGSGSEREKFGAIDPFGITNIRQSSADLAELDDTCDRVHSFTVFQHISRARGEVILKAILDHLLCGRVGVMQLTYHRQAR